MSNFMNVKSASLPTPMASNLIVSDRS